MRIVFESKRDWDPMDHPRDPNTGKFVERMFGRLRIDPVDTGLFHNVTEGFHKRPNAQATHFSDLPQDHRSRMYEVWQERRGKTGTKAESFPDLKRNIKALWDDAAPETKQDGRLWYRRAKQATLRSAREHGVDRDSAIAVTAALSPQQPWQGNIAMADHLMGVFASDRVYTPDEAEIARLLDPPEVKNSDGEWVKPQSYDVRPYVGKRFSEITDPDDAAVVFNSMMRADERTSDVPGHEAYNKDGSFTAVSASGGYTPISTAISILRGVPEDDALGGHKVRSFFNNISDPDNLLKGDDVTVDTHAVQAALDVLHLPPGGGDKVKPLHKKQKAAAAALLSGTPTKKDLNMSGLYAMFASAYRDVAEEVGVRPNQMQATIWIHWKNLKEAQR